MKYALIELPDDFEKGNCFHCPMVRHITGLYFTCALTNSDDRFPIGDSVVCSLEIKEDKDDNKTIIEQIKETS